MTSSLCRCSTQHAGVHGVRRRTRWWMSVVLVAAAVTGACGDRGPEPQPSISVSPPAPDPGRKVMIIAEENHGYEQIIGNPRASYLNRLATQYGTATDYEAGYPARCPSLAAYILMTSGAT